MGTLQGNGQGNALSWNQSAHIFMRHGFSLSWNVPIFLETGPLLSCNVPMFFADKVSKCAAPMSLRQFVPLTWNDTMFFYKSLLLPCSVSLIFIETQNPTVLLSPNVMYVIFPFFFFF